MIKRNVVIIPTYNEKENISILIPLIFNVDSTLSVLVADDNSPDGTATKVLELKNKYPNLSIISRQTKDGLGRAYINAFSLVLKDNDVRSIIMMDGDLSLQPKYLPEMIKKSEKYSVVIGSRYVKGSKIIGWDIFRRILSLGANIYCKIIMGMPVHDATCGYNVINVDLLRKIDLTNMGMGGYAFIIELKYSLYKMGATFFEVPITFIERTMGQSKISKKIILEGIFAPWKIIFK